MPQRSQTRFRSSGWPGGSSAGWPQREQNRIGLGRPTPTGVHDLSIRMRAVTPSDHNTEPMFAPVLRGQCTDSGPNLAQNLHRYAFGMAVQQELWGSETTKAVENFPVSGERVPAPVVRWLGRIKAAAARVNAELGLLDARARGADRRRRRRGRRGRARRPVPDRRLPDRLGHLVEHERQRGDREPRGRRASTPTTT